MNYSAQDIKKMSQQAYPQIYCDENRRSFVRACAAKILTTRRKVSPLVFAQHFWGEDEIAQTMLKAISTPTDRSSFPTIQAVRVLPALSPNAASSKLLALGMTIDMSGITTIRVPSVGGSGRPAAPAFVPEGSPLPMVDLVVSAPTLGPTAKISLGAAITDEIQSASADFAEQIVSAALAIAVQQGIDVVLFGNGAATASLTRWIVEWHHADAEWWHDWCGRSCR